MLGLAAVLAAATLVLVVGRDGDGGSRPAAASSLAERDEVLAQAERAVVTLTTLDAEAAEASIRSWQDVTTGELRSALQGEQETVRQLIDVGETATTAAVQQAAVQTLDADAGTATVLVGLDITLTPTGGEAVVEPQRLVVTMARTDDGWRAADLATVPTGPAGATGPTDAVGAATTAGDPDEARALAEVSASIEELWSYDFRDLEATAGAPAEITTAAFREQYADTDADIRALASQARAVVTAEVVQAAVQDLDGEQAVVVVFLNQTAEQRGADRTTAGARLRVVAEQEDGSWKVAEAAAF